MQNFSPVYENTFALRTSDFDRYMRITPTAILDLFQEVAGDHAEKLGIGYETALKRDLIWVVTKIKFKIIKNPPMHSTVRVVTWPHKPGKLCLTRDYKIFDDKGQLLIIGTSEWVFMHIKRRRFVSAGDIYPIEQFCEDCTFEGKIGKVKAFDEAERVYELTPQFCDIDMNSHVNNTKYANFVLNALNPNEQSEIDIFQIDYHKELKENTPTYMHINSDGKNVTVMGKDKENTLMFSCGISYK